MTAGTTTRLPFMVLLPPLQRTGGPYCTRSTRSTEVPRRRSPRESASVGEERFQASGFVLELASHRAWQRRERLGHDVAVLDRPGSRDEPGDEKCLGDVAVHADDPLPVLLREHARPIDPRQQHVVPLWQLAEAPDIPSASVRRGPCVPKGVGSSPRGTGTVKRRAPHSCRIPTGVGKFRAWTPSHCAPAPYWG